jgi:hypothetical protein
MIENPWKALPLGAPYVLEEDRAQVDRYNARCEAQSSTDNEAFRLRTNLLPDPFIGRIEAPVIVLFANPGYTDGSRAARWKCDSDDTAHKRPDVEQLYRANYAQAVMDYPLFFLDPRMEQTPAGYWCRHLFLAALRKEIQDDRVLARSIALVEFFPYHSARYRFVKSFEVESQKYSRQLVVSAMNRRATIIVMRCRSALETAIPALKDYEYIKAASPQSPAASPGNLMSKSGVKDGFRRVIDAIKQ